MKLLIIFVLVISSIIVCSAEDKCNHKIGEDGKRLCHLCKAAFAPVCTKNNQNVLKTFPNNCSICVTNCYDNTDFEYIKDGDCVAEPQTANCSTAA